MLKSATVLVGAVLAAGLIAAPAAQASGTAHPNIIGGSTASNAPWGAQIYWDSQGFECSGTIIAAQWVLTAQHCLASSGGMSVRVGSLNLGEGTQATVDRTETAPNGDLLLLHLANAVDATYITLGSADPAVGDTNQIYGWGRTQGSNPPSPVLKTANVQVTGTSTDAFNGPAIASKGVDGSAWHGDSGGPEIAGGVQVGVCSTGENSGSDVNGTQNYASVANSRDWIQQTAGV
ncbi:S1 family peptidase [Kutzneria sp. CA-103260]|uniref:S1 family peptidase n=1 Tax=Kutzneria sp. CA-103260 TaxID=2802641 RepID=UPI001BAD2C3A|nr:trypsin-like serine protease [Kutzneria sp. CA-103260]QUQ65544.1 trypsin-like serine protease [Kutzneria sp. CA-103260]